MFRYVNHAWCRIRKYTSCARSTGQGNDFELIPTVQLESQHSVRSVPTCHDFPRFVFISEKSRPEVGSQKSLCTNVFRKDSWRHRSTYCVQISWNLADRKLVKSCVICLTKNKISTCVPAFAPKICQAIYSECPKFHPNLFTAGGVIAERVNVVETSHKAFPILGEATASSPSNEWMNEWRFWW